MLLRNYGCRITDQYTFYGYKTIVMENELLRISILVDKGTDIFEFLYKPLDMDFMWRNNWGFKHPARDIPSIPLPVGNFVDYYFGGWQEIFPIGGMPCEYKNTRFGLHGEVSLIPWDYQVLEDSEEQVTVKFTVRTNRTPFLVVKTLSLKANTPILYIQEKVINIGEEEMDYMWGHHPAFGGRFLDETCVIDCPADKIETNFDPSPTSRIVPGIFTDWPYVKALDGSGRIDLSKIPPKSSRSKDMAFITELRDGWYALTNTGKKVGFGMRWDKTIFKHIWYWMVFGGEYECPSYGRNYNMALEPFSSYTIHGSFPEIIKEGAQLRLNPGESLETELMAVAYAGMTGVQDIQPDGTVIPK